MKSQGLEFVFGAFCLILASTGEAMTNFHANDHPGLSDLKEYQAATQRYLAIKNSKEYGDRCVYDHEKGRTSIVNRIMNTPILRNFAEMTSVTEEMHNLADSVDSFCNSYKKLECQPNGYCGCTNRRSLGFQMWSIREKGECRLSFGSSCFPPKANPMKGRPNARCRETSECVMINSTDPCTEERVQKKLIQDYGGIPRAQENPNGYSEYASIMDLDGNCVCTGDADHDAGVGRPMSNTFWLILLPSTAIATFL